MFVFDSQTKLYVLFPSKSFISRKPHGYNNYSTVFKLTHGEVDFIFTGDVEEKGESYLTLWKKFLNAEVLKVPHHGSCTSSTTEFIKYVDPDYAFISVGQYNRFNHPCSTTLDRYDSLGVRIFRSDSNGALVMRSDGKKVKVVDW